MTDWAVRLCRPPKEATHLGMHRNVAFSKLCGTNRPTKQPKDGYPSDLLEVVSVKDRELSRASCGLQALLANERRQILADVSFWNCSRQF